MASKTGPRALGTDGSDFMHRERVASHYKARWVWRSSRKGVRGLLLASDVECAPPRLSSLPFSQAVQCKSAAAGHPLPSHSPSLVIPLLSSVVIMLHFGAVPLKNRPKCQTIFFVDCNFETFLGVGGGGETSLMKSCPSAGPGICLVLK